MNTLIRTLSSLPVLILLCATAVMILKRPAFGKLYADGVYGGLDTIKGMLAPMLMLCISVKLITACGIIDGICSFLSDTFTKFVPASLLPLIITRPISGSASNAALSELIENFGAESYEVFLAAVMMSSSDTCFYIHSVYFSAQTQKKSGTVLLLMLAVSVISAIICILICRQRFNT